MFTYLIGVLKVVKKRLCIWFETQVRFNANAKAFYLKCTCVLIQTSKRFVLNTSVF